MPRSLSKSQIDKLGERLVKESPAREEDLRQLGALRAEYLAPLLEVVRRVRESVRVEPSYRLKTNATIIEKLRRARTRLSSMQDVGGLRVVVLGSLDDQDWVINQVEALFQQSKLEDRRVRPSAGYRAVHLIVELDGFPIEIQVRTYLQDLWAQMFERLADHLGRGIRYGESPSQPAEQQAVDVMLEMADYVQANEQMWVEVQQLEQGLLALDPREAAVQTLNRQIEELKSKVAMRMAGLVAIMAMVTAKLGQVDK